VAEDGNLGNLAGVELGDAVLGSKAAEAEGVRMALDDSPRDALCCRDPGVDGRGV
jgi:hypothetical protein